MTPRQRFLETILFGNPDRVPLVPGYGRRSTLATWRQQGLPAHVTHPDEYAYRQAGGAHDWPGGTSYFPVNFRMIPEFEEKVLEVRDETQIVQDWKGNVCEISKEYSTEYLRNAIDFVTRRWIRCPVENHDDWERMKARYDAGDPKRLPAQVEELGRSYGNREQVLQITIPGPFWQMREWMGFENLCMSFHDQPYLIWDMVSYYEDFVAILLEQLYRYTDLDMVHVSEDIAYKGFCMISPAMMREYLLPTYKLWGEISKSAGVPVYAMDSDGYIGEIIPLWIEAGFNMCDPIEIAAGNDPLEFRRSFGKKMAYRGAVDKRVIAKGGTAIEEELARLQPLIEDGGYIPTCDHGVPADVSWPHYVHYTGVLARATGWL